MPHTRPPHPLAALARFAVALSSLAAAYLAGEPLAAAEHRYWALYDDGAEVTGGELRHWLHETESPQLSGEKLFEGKAPLRTLRDRQRSWRLRPPYLELANGDILPGFPRGVEGLEGEGDLPPHLRVEGLPETAFVEGREEVRVRLAAVARLVLRPGHGELEPGMIALRDGRQLQTRSWRWTRHGLRVLSSEGVLDLAFEEIAAAAVPHVETLTGLRDDAAAPSGDSPLLVRLRTTDGGCFTFPQGMVQSDVPTGRVRWRRRRGESLPPQVKPIAIQPAWTFQAMLLDPDAMVQTSYRRRDELPLSLLPLTHHESGGGIHAWSPRRQESVRGTPLRSGSLQADLGFGVHGDSRLTLELPPEARELSGWAGIDRLAGAGGSVHCRLLAAGDRPRALWETSLSGADGPARFGPLSVKGVSQLELVTESTPAEPRAGADPWDVRDHLDWLLPMLRLEDWQPDSFERPIGHWIPELDGWELAAECREAAELRPAWDADELRWKYALAWRADAAADEHPLRLVRRETITPANAWLPLEASRADGDGDGVVFILEAYGEKIGTTMNGNLCTAHVRPWKYNSRVWGLGPCAGREVELTLRIEPYRNRPTGTVFRRARLLPLVQDLGPARRPLMPQVPLAQLTPLVVEGVEGEQLREGRTADGKPLALLGYPFSAGFALPQGTELTYELRPEYRRFVACIGLADGYKGAGPYEVLLDGKPHWDSGSGAFGRNDPGRQIDVPIPPGHRRITIRIRGDESFGALAHPGFLTE